MTNITNNRKCFIILALLIHSVFSSSQNNNAESKENEKLREEHKPSKAQESSKAHKKNKSEVSSNAKRIREFTLNPNAAVFTPSSTQNLSPPELPSNQIAKQNISYPDSRMVLPGSSSNRNVVSNSASPNSNSNYSHGLSSSRSMDPKQRSTRSDNRPIVSSPGSSSNHNAVYSASNNANLTSPALSSSRRMDPKQRSRRSDNRPVVSSPGSSSNRNGVYNSTSPYPNLTSPRLSSSRIMDPKRRLNNEPAMILPGLPGPILPLYVPPYNPYVVLPGPSASLHAGINPFQNLGPVVVPPLNPNVIEPVSSSDPGIGTSASSESSQSKIRPFLREMSLISQKARAEDSKAPEFSLNPILHDFVIIMHDNLQPVKPTTEEVEPMINKINVYDSSLKIIYEGYPRLSLDSIDVNYNPQDYLSIDPSLRKSNEEIGADIAKIIVGKLVVGFKSKTKNFNNIYGIPNFERRDLGSLIKFCDMLESKPFTVRKFNVRLWKLKDLASQFLGKSGPELGTFTRELVVQYMRELYLHFRMKWEAEVQFLKRQIWYYKYVNKADLKAIFSQYGPYYPGFHKDGNEFALKYAKSVLPSNLYGIHITIVPDSTNRIESVAIYKANNLKLLFRGFVDIDSSAKKTNKKYYSVSELASILSSFLQQKRKRPSVITGYDIVENVRALDKNKELKYVTVYDTKNIFYGESITEIAYEYLHVDYRAKYFKDWKEKNLTSRAAFSECDKTISVELFAKISMQLFRLYGLHAHPRVAGVPV